MTTRLALSALLFASIAACKSDPKLPAERAAAVQEAADDVTHAEEKLDRAVKPNDVVAASKDLSSASIDFQKDRDAALRSVGETLETIDKDIRTLVDTRSQTEFQLQDEARKADSAIGELVEARSQLEATLNLMRVATPETWSPLKTRVDALTARMRDARSRAFDALF